MTVAEVELVGWKDEDEVGGTVVGPIFVDVAGERRKLAGWYPMAYARDLAEALDVRFEAW